MFKIFSFLSILVIGALANEGPLINQCGFLGNNLIFKDFHYSVAFYDGEDSILLMGGHSSNMERTLYRYSIINGALEAVTDLPKSLFSGFGSLETTTNDYLHLGGFVDYLNSEVSPPSREMFQVDRHDLSVLSLGHRLRVGRNGQSGVTIGDMAYLIGGDVCGPKSYSFCPVSTIEAFNLTSLETEYIVDMTEYPLYGTTSASDEEFIYIFGGAVYEGASKLDQILQFEIRTSVIRVLDVKLPVPITKASATTLGNMVYIIPGDISEGSYGNLITFNMATQEVGEVSMNGMRSDVEGSSVYVEKQNRIYSFGRFYDENEVLRGAACINLA